MKQRVDTSSRFNLRMVVLIAAGILVSGLVTVCSGERPAAEPPADLAVAAVDATDTTPEPSRAGASLEDLYPQYEVVARLSGSFSSPGSEETLLLLVNPRQVFRDSSSHHVHRVLWIPEGASGIDGHLDISIDSIGYRDIEVEMLAAFSSALGAEHPVFPVTDFSGSGRDEIFFLATHGMGSSLLVLEYDAGEFRFLMRGTIGVRLVTKIDVVDLIDGSRGIRVYGLGSKEGPRGTRDWYEHAWDDESKQYEVVRQGNEGWDEVWW